MHIRGSYNTGKHLDYILLAGYFLNMVEEAEVLPKMFSDHNAISVMLQFNRNPKGKGYWKFQDALLANENYLNFIKQQIKQTVEVNKNSTTPDVLWDTVKCSIRESTCRFLKADKNNDKIKYESFQAELAELHHLMDGSYHPKVRERYNDRIVQVTKDWESFSQTLQKKALDFSIGRKRQQDEKSSKYFIRKYNAIPGSSTMFNTEGEACTTDSEILGTCFQFYNKLYMKTYSSEDSPYAFLPVQPLLTPTQTKTLQEDITLEELSSALCNMKKGKAPGMDGINVAFYQELWSDIEHLVFNSIIWVEKKAQLSVSQHRGIIKLIPKKDKNPHFVGNLRPITLLNVDVKILTKALGNRLKEIVKEIVSSDQQAFIQGQYLGNSALDLYAAAATALEQDENYLAISLDIEKAFDSVNWDFLYKLLMHMGFPPQFIHWVQTLHNGKELRIFNNRHSSQPIQVSNGLAQGCSLSPLLFIFCMEALVRVIKGSPLLKGIECQGVEKRVGMVADDTMLFLKATTAGIQEIESILLAFEKTVGLKVNFEKNHYLLFGQ